MYQIRLGCKLIEIWLSSSGLSIGALKVQKYLFIGRNGGGY